MRVLQQKQSNYDTDVFTGTIAATEKITGQQYHFGDDKKDIAFRVLADHIRAIAFTIADGQLPANTGAGYVIRRILRRAVRYYYSYLHYKQPLLFQLMPVLAKQFATVFPELQQQVEYWADEASLDLLNFILETMRTAPIFILAISRYEQTGALERAVNWARQNLAERFHHYQLKSLTHDQSRELLNLLLSIPDLPESLRDQILNRSAGVPFYLEEILAR